MSFVVDVPWFRLDADCAVIWSLRGSSMERGSAGPSAAESALCACRATATVLHACAGKEVATRSHQDAWAAPNGATATARHAGAGGPGRHRRQEGAKRACEAPDKQAWP